MMNILSAAMSIPDAGITGLLGYAVVFLGLLLLMIVVVIMGKTMSAGKAKAPKAAPAPAPVVPEAAPAAAPAATGNEAPGSAGQLKLYDTPDRDAAMIMAIVADQMGKPLNELRFQSIKEVK